MYRIHAYAVGGFGVVEVHEDRLVATMDEMREMGWVITAVIRLS